MILTSSQAEQLREALVGAFTPASLEMFLDDKFGKKLHNLVNPAAAPDFPYLVYKLIDVANTEGWVLKLAQEAHQEHQHQALLATFIESLPAGQLATSAAPAGHLVTDAIPTHLLSATCLYGSTDMCFLNRDRLRNALRALDTGVARIATIDGPEHSGKSYSYQLILYLADMSQRFQPVFIDLTQASGPNYGPDRLATRIALQMGIDLPPERLLKKEAQGAIWATELSEYLIGRTHAASKQWWVVLDGILQGSLPPDTGHFIHALAQGALQAPKLRVVLLSYKQEMLPSNVQFRAVGETIPPVQDLDLHEFFERLLDSHGTEPKASMIDFAVNWIAERVAPPYHGESLAQLPALVGAACQILNLHEFFEKLLDSHGREPEDGVIGFAVNWVAERVAPPPYHAESLAQLPALVQEASDILLSV
jgi:hypothetical protein